MLRGSGIKMTTFIERRDAILARVALAAARAGRDPSTLALTAVSKVQPDERIEEALAAGQRVFGENRVQEAQQRWIPRREANPHLHLRLIGPLQTNKVRDAIALFDAIETLDRPKLAAALADAIQTVGRSPELYVQVNTGEEPQKAGVLPRETDAFIAALRRDFGIKPAGLMCIPPVDEPAGVHFALLARIGARNGLKGLSMGMSDDFETAIAFGSTRIRIGSALFGERTYSTTISMTDPGPQAASAA